MRKNVFVVLAGVLASQASATTIVESDFVGDFNTYDVYEFSINLGGGARFEGAFVGADLNDDGRIGSDSFIDQTITFNDGVTVVNPKEVPLLRGQYIGPVTELASLGSQDYEFETGPFEVPFATNWVSFHLDGDPSFGGPTVLPFPETMTIRIGPEFGFGGEGATTYALSAGEVPWQVADAESVGFGENVPFLEVLPCDGVGDCARLYEKTDEIFGVGGGGDILIEVFEEVSASTSTDQFVLSGPLGTPLGATEAAARLPDEFQEDGGFRFDIDFDSLAIPPGQIFFIDPDIAVGYTYEVTGALFTSVQAPSLGAVNDPDGYTLTYGTSSFTLLPGEIHTFTSPVSIFEISGISEDLMLDPDNELAFVTGISLDDTSGMVSIFQTPQTVFVDPSGGNGGGGTPTPVPLPAGALLLLTGIGGLFGFRRRKM